ncbi:cation:proton antiporter [Erythrobacter cryptus]|uniref:cation:proton antiporter n=1 Tax=Erythrobacter cryptus TaxID=196588 RepID=UPI00040563DA|nr:cation:proton antiporter [Erythrobacter cryptus]
MNITEIYLIALAIVFAVPWLVWRLGRTDHWAPLVVVQIVGGILLGPGVLGAAFPDYYAFVFRPDVIMALNGVAWWAVMLFVWIAGIELDLSQAWQHRRETGLTAGLALGVPLLAGTAAAAIILQFPGWRGPKGEYWQALLGIGMSCAVTALPILVLLMDKLGILREQLGQRILRYASLDDIAIWGVLALILLDFDRLARQALFILGFAFAAWAMRWVMARIGAADRWAVGLIWLAMCGFAGDWAGLHFMVGAFLAGVVLDARWFGHEAMDRFRDVVLLTIMPVFFLSTGLRTQWEGGGLTVFAVAGLLLAAAVGGKLLGVHIAGRLLGWSRAEARLIGWLLQTKALIMIIFANILLDKQVITPTTFTALLLMAVASTMLTKPFASPLIAKLGARVKAEA